MYSKPELQIEEGTASAANVPRDHKNLLKSRVTIPLTIFPLIELTQILRAVRATSIMVRAARCNTSADHHPGIAIFQSENTFRTNLISTYPLSTFGFMVFKF